MRSAFPVRFLKDAVKSLGAVLDFKKLTRSALEKSSDALTRVMMGYNCFNFLGFFGSLRLFLLGGTVRRTPLLSFGSRKCEHKSVDSGEVV